MTTELLACREALAARTALLVEARDALRALCDGFPTDHLSSYRALLAKIEAAL